MTWLSAEISVFASAIAPQPISSSTIGDVLFNIRNGAHRSIIDRLRPLADASDQAWRERNGSGRKTEAELRYDAQKKQLRAVTFSGLFSYRNEQSLTSHSGILCVDLDHVDDIDALRLMIEFDPHTAFCFTSPSGHGLKIGVRIDPARHRESFHAAEQYFFTTYGARLDQACKDPSRLCFVSFDEGLFINEQASELEIPENVTPLPVDEPQRPAPATNGHARSRTYENEQPTADDVRELLRFIDRRPEYPDWIKIIAAVADVLGENEAIAVLEEWSPPENGGEYRTKIRQKLEKVSYASLVYMAQQRGYERPKREREYTAPTNDAPPPDDKDAPPTQGTSKQLPPIDISQASTLAELAPAVNKRLNRRTSRIDKQHVATRVIDWLAENERLLTDVANPEEPIPYMLTDDGAAVAIIGENKYLRFALNEAGINASESVFNWLINDLQARTIREGREVKLAHFATVRDDALYISSGRRQIVIAKHGEPLRVVANGTDDVLFAAEYVLTEWRPTTPVALSILQAFRPTLVAPPEAPDYTPASQHLLLESWVLAAFMGIRPLPILVPVGQKGSGKSTTAKITSMIFRGAAGDVSSVPNNQRDFNASMAALPIYVIDNLDTEPQPWMIDALATACTGGMVQERRLYTNYELTERKLDAALAITTRTAVFAERSDIKERVLPIFYGELAGDLRGDRMLKDEVLYNRDGVLSYLATEGASLLGDETPAAGFASRFQEFAKVATRDPNVDGNAALSAWIKAQALGVTDNDPLLQAILDWHDEIPLTGTATELVKQLSGKGADIPHQGGGKKIARKLREMKSALIMAGMIVREQQMRDRTYFEILRQGQPSIMPVSEMTESTQEKIF